MDIFHRIFISTSQGNFVKTVQSLGIPHNTSGMHGKTLWLYFDIKESDPNWKVIAKLIEKEGASDRYETIFDDNEIRRAEWLRLISVFEQGYPQPKSNWPIKQQSYGNVCQKCGIYTQVNSLRIQKEPHLGKKSFMSPIWVGELLCTSDVISNFDAIQAQGFTAWDVKIHKTDQPSNLIFQLFVSNITAPGLVIDDSLTRVVCPVCKTVKYYPHMKNKMFIKRKALPQKVDFIKTYEWFGSGLIAYRELLISNRIAQLILDKKWKGVRLKVVELV